MGAVKRTHHAVVLREIEVKGDRRYEQHHRDSVCSIAYLLRRPDKCHIVSQTLADLIPTFVYEQMMKNFTEYLGRVCEPIAGEGMKSARNLIINMVPNNGRSAIQLRCRTMFGIDLASGPDMTGICNGGGNDKG